MKRNASHVMRCYRGHILACKRKWGTARGLIHYRALVDEYARCKREHEEKARRWK